MEALKKKIEEDGYCILHNVLTDEECDHYKLLLEADYKKYSPQYIGSNNASTHGLENKSTEKIVFNIHNKHIDWYKLFEHPSITPILDMMLKDGSYLNSEPYLLLNNSARNPLKGNKGQQLHLDSNLPGGHYPLSMVVIFMFDDFTKSNGGTRIVPGSHKFTTYAEDGKVYPEEVIVEAPKGSVLIYNASLWHGGGEKINDNDRWSLILSFGRWFLKPSFDFMKNTPRAIYDQLTDKQKDLLGFRCTPPKDEFTRLRRKSTEFETPVDYHLPE
jgi:ectoine hydroxylase-related dioxygenase (phytanoyl-CoA dioxygenase family)